MDLASYCNDLAQASADAGEWVGRNTDLVRNETESLQKDLRRAKRLFRGCARAASGKMCAGVFGPSQAGKSYLISALARGAGNQLKARFGDECHDFLSEINPQGGQESTGLVTRFTLTQPKDLPKDFPVRARLLSETDLVKIIANTYYEDCEHKDPAKNDIGKSIAEIRKLGTPGNSRVDLDDMEELHEYISAHFMSKARASDLERLYWEEAMSLAPRLDLEGRVRLYSIIWDEVEELTALLRSLMRDLENLDYPEHVNCGMDALLPRQSSIINVETLDGLSGAEVGPDLEIMTPAGKKAKISRGALTALTAELVIFMEEQPAPYFEHTDLLDFPGYRSRYKFDDIRKALEAPNMLKELFRRGKVAYLFQRYCASHELNTMLLCIGPSNQEVQDLPGVINDWICATHGSTPEEREKRRVSLLFVLTKTDEEFGDKAGERDEDRKARWDIRLKASLLDFFGKQYDWPARWTPTRGFDNIFLLRNPNFKFEAVMNYNGNEETGIRPERKDFVEKIHAAFLESPLVGEHFRDPAKSWEELMRLNDGGISHIRESLEPLCDPKIKEQQLLANVNECREALARRLGAFYKSDDREELRKQKIALARDLSQRLGRLEISEKRMGRLLRDFIITDTEIYDMYPQIQNRYEEMRARDTSPEGKDDESGEAAYEAASLGFENFNPLANVIEREEQPGEKETPRDDAAIFADFIESKWVEKLHKLADDPDAQKYYMLSPGFFQALASELATGADRIGLGGKMAEEFRKVASYANMRKESVARKQAAIAAHILNNYVDWLDYSPRDKNEKDRTFQLPGARQPATVFQPPPAVIGQPALGPTPAPYTLMWLKDWLNALASLIMDNVYFDGQKTINLEENAALGTILKRIEKAPATSDK